MKIEYKDPKIFNKKSDMLLLFFFIDVLCIYNRLQYCKRYFIFKILFYFDEKQKLYTKYYFSFYHIVNILYLVRLSYYLSKLYRKINKNIFIQEFHMYIHLER